MPSEKLSPVNQSLDRAALAAVVAGGPLERMEDRLQLRLGAMLDADEGVAGAFRGADHLVELGLDRRSVAVLRVLDQEDHQEGDDGRAGVDDQLPGVRPFEDG